MPSSIKRLPWSAKAVALLAVLVAADTI